MQQYEMLEKKGIKKKMMDVDYCEEYLTGIEKQIKAELWKASSHLADICRLMKNQSSKKR